MIDLENFDNMKKYRKVKSAHQYFVNYVIHSTLKNKGKVLMLEEKQKGQFYSKVLFHIGLQKIPNNYIQYQQLLNKFTK